MLIFRVCSTQEFQGHVGDLRGHQGVRIPADCHGEGRVEMQGWGQGADVGH